MPTKHKKLPKLPVPVWQVRSLTSKKLNKLKYQQLFVDLKRGEVTEKTTVPKTREIDREVERNTTNRNRNPKVRTYPGISDKVGKSEL